MNKLSFWKYLDLRVIKSLVQEGGAERKACGGKIELQKEKKMGGIREFLSRMDLIRVRRAVGQNGKEQKAWNTAERK